MSHDNYGPLAYFIGNWKSDGWTGDNVAPDPFHEEVGYFIWDAERKQVMKSFIVPRGIAVNAGGTAEADSKEFFLAADCGDETYGVCSNKFLYQEFKTVRYEVTFKKLDENTFSYDEDTTIKMKDRGELFHHTETNVMKRL